MEEEEQQSGGGRLIRGTPDDDTLQGTQGDDTILGGAGNDELFGGGGNNLLKGEEGDDKLIGGTGKDTMFGGPGDDVFLIDDDFGNHQITGGLEDQTFGDLITAAPMSQDVRVTYTGDGTGTIDRDATDTADAAQVSFTEIERMFLGTGDDVVTVDPSTSGWVHGGAGFDTLILPDPEDGEGAPQVNVTNRIENDDGTVSKDGFVIFADGSRLDFKSFEEIICFTPGTLIDTARGRVAVQDLGPGDRVLTRDHGYQPLVWTGRRDLTAAELAANPALAPVRIAAGALGANLPARDLMVSPRHRILVSGARAQAMFGERELLVAACDLLGLPGITQDAAEAASYVHVMCARHEILRSEGAWSESFQPAAGVLDALEEAVRAELLALFPALARPEGQRAYASARPVLARPEDRALFAA